MTSNADWQKTLDAPVLRRGFAIDHEAEELTGLTVRSMRLVGYHRGCMIQQSQPVAGRTFRTYPLLSLFALAICRELSEFTNRGLPWCANIVSIVPLTDLQAVANQQMADGQKFSPTLLELIDGEFVSIRPLDDDAAGSNPANGVPLGTIVDDVAYSFDVASEIVENTPPEPDDAQFKDMEAANKISMRRVEAVQAMMSPKTRASLNISSVASELITKLKSDSA